MAEAIRRTEFLKTIIRPGIARFERAERRVERAARAVRTDRSRCLRMRFNRNSCAECVKVCRVGALKLDGGLALDKEKCTGCMLCASVCPSASFETRGPGFRAMADRLDEHPAPVLGCSTRASSGAHERFPCLGFLSEEHLVFLAAFLRSPLQINLADCGKCENGFIAAGIKEKLARIGEGISSRLSERIKIVEDSRDLDYTEAACRRRDFFKSLRGIAKRTMEGLLDDRDGGGISKSYGKKELPDKRFLLNEALPRLREDERRRVLERRYFSVSVDGKCDGCASCAAICPTGALKPAKNTGGRKKAASALTFNSSLCTGCGLCRDFCGDGFLTLATGAGAEGLSLGEWVPTLDQPAPATQIRRGIHKDGPAVWAHDTNLGPGSPGKR